MSEKDEFKKFREKLLKVKTERESKNQWESDEQGNIVIERAKTAIMPVIKTFVDIDPFLELQSSNLRWFYISYANTKICGISILTSGDTIHVDILHDSEKNAYIPEVSTKRKSKMQSRMNF